MKKSTRYIVQSTTYKVFLVSLFLTLLMTSCGNKQEVEVETVDSTALSVAVLPTMECLPFYVADECGLFDSLGVNVRLLTFDASMDADTAFCRGAVDVAVTDLFKACLWGSQGDSIGIVLGNDLHLFLVTAQSARIKQTKSIKEKIIGITRHSVVDYTADQMLASIKLGNDELNRPQINDISLRASMVDQQQYDGALLPEPYATLSVSRGGTRVTGTDSLGIGQGLMVAVANDSVLHIRKHDLQLLVKAYDMAVDLINQKAQKEAPRLLSYIPMEQQLPDSLAAIPTFHHSTPPTDSLITQASDWLRSRNLYGKSFSFIQPD